MNYQEVTSSLGLNQFALKYDLHNYNLNEKLNFYKQKLFEKDNQNLITTIIDDVNQIFENLSDLQKVCPFKLNLAGGSLRDLILDNGKNIKDLDIFLSIDDLNLTSLFISNDKNSELLKKLNEKIYKIYNFLNNHNIKFFDENEGDEYYSFIKSKFLTEESEIENLSKLTCNLFTLFQFALNFCLSNNKNFEYLPQNKISTTYFNKNLFSIHRFEKNFKIDLIMSSYDEPLNSFDFEICKFETNLKYKMSAEDFINFLQCSLSAIIDLEEKKFSYKLGKFSIDEQSYFFSKHLVKLQNKYPDFELNPYIGKSIQYSLENIETFKKDLAFLKQYKISKNLVKINKLNKI